MFENFNFKKKYGQNFLVDKNIVNKIINNVESLTDSLVIEIGCGDGKLTNELCKKFDYVLGYEIDLDVKDRLIENLSTFNNYKIIFDDFLSRNLVDDISDFSYSNICVIANLPYYVTTAIIEKLISSGINFEFMNFMVQNEVADRFSANVGTKEYNSLTVFLNYKYDVKKLFVVSRRCFYPVPNVDSAIVSFKKKKNKCIVLNEDLFFKLIRDSFKFKRKTLKNNLSMYNLEIISNTLKKYNFDLSVRAEQLSIEIFCDIANALSMEVYNEKKE